MSYPASRRGRDSQRSPDTEEDGQAKIVKLEHAGEGQAILGEIKHLPVVYILEDAVPEVQIPPAFTVIVLHMANLLFLVLILITLVLNGCTGFLYDFTLSCAFRNRLQNGGGSDLRGGPSVLNLHLDAMDQKNDRRKHGEEIYPGTAPE